MICPRCNRPNAPSSRFCGECGKALGGPSRASIAPRPGDAATQAAGTRPPGGAGTDSMAATMAGSTLSSPGIHLGILPRGFVLGARYEIQEALGMGGMGMVYRAHDHALDTTVALKMIRAEYAENDRVLERFKQEITIARKVTHRNVTRIYDLGQAEGLRYISMEFVEGKDLARIVSEKGRLPVEEAISILRQVCAALKEAHAVGVVHRDLKPQNIMLDEAGCAHVMDFGIAMSEDLRGMTRTGALIGTPEYMSPEQAEGRRVDHRSDIYSLGITLYEILSGSAPFKGDTTWEVIRKQIQQPARSIRRERPDLPEWLDTLILKCLEKDPAIRYQAVGEILADLDRQEAHLSARRYLPSRRALALMAGALTLVLSAIAVTMAFRPKAPTAGAGGRRSVAILPFENLTGRADLEWLRTGLAENLTTDLSESQYFRVLSRERLSQILREIGLDDLARLDAGALRKIGEFGAVEAIVTGSFLSAGDQLRVNLRMQDPQTGEIFRSGRIERGESEVFTMIDDLTRTTKQLFDLAPDRIASDADLEMAAARTSSVEAASLYQRGVDLLHQSRYLESVEPLREAVAADPAFSMGWARLAEAHMRTGHEPEAVDAVRRAMDGLLAQTARLTQADRTFIAALNGRINNRPEESVRAYEEILAVDPDDAGAFYHLGEVHEETGDFAAAEKRYREAIRKDANNAALVYALGRVQIKAGRPREAIEDLSRTLDLYTKMGSEEGQGNALNALAVAHERLGDYEQAMESYKRSEEIRRRIGDTLGLAKTLDNRAGILQLRGRLDEARRTEEEALALSREIGDTAQIAIILDNLGSLREESGDPEGVLRHYSESLELHRSLKDRAGEVTVLIGLSRGEAALGRLDEATERLREAAAIADELQLGSELAEVLSEQGQIAQLKGDLAYAIAAQERAIERWRADEREDGEAEARLRMAMAQELGGALAEARANIDAALKVYAGLGDQTNQVRARFALARLEISTGRPDRARVLLAESEGGLRALSNPILRAHAGFLQARAALMEGQPGLARAAAEQTCAAAAGTRAVVPMIQCGIATAFAAPPAEAITQATVAGTRANDAGLLLMAAEADLALAQAHARAGQLDRAGPPARRALQVATRCRLLAIAPGAALLAARSGRAEGNPAAAATALRDALELVERASRGLPREQAEALRARPDIRALREEPPG